MTTQHLSEDQLLQLIPRHIHEDLRQDIYIALREANPETDDDADIVIRRLCFRHRYDVRAERQRIARSCIDDAADGRSGGTEASAVLNSIDPADRAILVDRFITELPVSVCAERLGVSQPTYRKRLESVLLRTRLQLTTTE